MDRLLKATFRDYDDGRPELELDFETIGRVTVNCDVKRNFLEAGLVPANGYDGDLPIQSFTQPDGEIVRLHYMIKNAEAAKVTLLYTKALDLMVKFRDGEILYQAREKF